MYGLWVMGELWVFHTKSLQTNLGNGKSYGLYINDRPGKRNGIGINCAYQQIKLISHSHLAIHVNLSHGHSFFAHEFIEFQNKSLLQHTN